MASSEVKYEATDLESQVEVCCDPHNVPCLRTENMWAGKTWLVFIHW